MAINAAQVMFIGAVLVVMLFASYGLYEWARYVLQRRRSGWPERKANLAFGAVATLVAFLPCIALSLGIKLQPIAEEMIVDVGDIAIVRYFFFALMVGLAFELVAMIAFAVKASKIK
jgi:hypothetical protein